VERICWKGRFWAWSMKEWRSDGWWATAGMIREMGWQVDEEVNRDKTGEADGMNREVDSKDEWCISKWAICDFQGRHGRRPRKSDNKWGADTARRLKSDKVVKLARLSSCKNFVSERKEFIFDALTFSQWRDLRMEVMCV